MEVSALPKGEGFDTQEVDISNHEILILLWGDMNEKNLKDAGGLWKFCDTTGTIPRRDVGGASEPVRVNSLASPTR